MRHMLFIDDRPCTDRRPCSFNYALFERRDVLPILVRFPQTFAEFSPRYLSLTERFPSFMVDPDAGVEDEAARLAAWCRGEGLAPDAFCCMSEPQQEYGNRLAELMGLPALPAATTRALRHKPEMKRWLREAGLDTADYREVHDVDEVRAFAAEVGYPIILKPAAGWGTLRTHRIDDDAGVEQHRAQIEGAEATMVESFVSDEEIEVCALVSRGRVLDTFVSKMPAPPLAIAQGAISANISIGAHKRAIPVDFDGVTQTIVDKFGLRNGYLHMEWFVDESGARVRVGELALRYPGCEIAKNHGLAHGFDIAQVTADLYLGLVPKLETTRERCVGDLLLPYRPGRVVAHSTREALERMPGVIEAHLAVREGDVLPPVPSSSFNCVGWVFVEGETPHEVEERMHLVHESFVLDTVTT